MELVCQLLSVAMTIENWIIKRRTELKKKMPSS